MDRVWVRNKPARTVLLLCLLLIAAAAQGDEPSGPGEGPGVNSAKPSNGAGSPPSPGPTREFAGLFFGVGISLTIDTGSSDRVESASVVNGIVRVTDENNAVARIMLESHYFFKAKSKILGLFDVGPYGHGPFIALQPGTDEIIEAAGLGWMWGFKRASASAESSDSWNLGIGFIVDPNVQVLGDGVYANQPLPPGETEIRYKEEAQYGILIVTSFSF